jgi:urease accessory protein
MATAAPVTAPDGRGNWEAELDLVFESRAGGTVLSRRAHRGPLLVQRPFYPEGTLCHVYLLHPPAGIVGGDRLRLDVRVGDGAQALLTTPAATKFYRSDGRHGEVAQRLSVDPGATLEWLPQENIVFDAARARVRTEIDLSNGARFIGWDTTCLGRPATAEVFGSGQWQQQLQLRLEAAPMISERIDLDGRQHWERIGLRGGDTIAALYAYPCTDAAIDAARAAIDAAAPSFDVGVTLCDGVLVCRSLATDADRTRRLLLGLWQVLRPLVIGREACAPRIWAT